MDANLTGWKGYIFPLPRYRNLDVRRDDLYDDDGDSSAEGFGV